MLPTQPPKLAFPSFDCRALGFLACDSGGALIVRASGETTLAAAAAVLQDSVRQPPEVMRCCTDWLRLLVSHALPCF
jgi:hypothetical protein